MSVSWSLKNSPTRLWSHLGGKSLRFLIFSIIFLNTHFSFQRRIGNGINILPHRRVYVHVSLEHPERSSKLILRNCWLSDCENTTQTSLSVITNGCPVNEDIHILPISLSAVGFSFETAYFRRASQSIDRGRLLQLYVKCETRLCQVYETDAECIQNYCLQVDWLGEIR